MRYILYVALRQIPTRTAKHGDIEMRKWCGALPIRFEKNNTQLIGLY